MRVFIVHAHPKPNSFNGALTHTATQALRSAGHEVVVSDLYAMDWDPVSDRRNFTTRFDPEYVKQQAEEQYAASHDGFAHDVQMEQEKLFWCDVLTAQRGAVGESGIRLVEHVDAPGSVHAFMHVDGARRP